MRLILISISFIISGGLFAQSHLDIVKSIDNNARRIDKMNLDSQYFDYDIIKTQYVFMESTPCAMEIKKDTTGFRKINFQLLSREYHIYIDIYFEANKPFKIVELEQNFPTLTDSNLVIYSERNEVFRMNYYIQSWSESKYFTTYTGKRMYSKFTGLLADFEFIISIGQSLIKSKAKRTDNRH
jgi:hypothetical protein